MKGFAKATDKASLEASESFQRAGNKFLEAMSNPNWAESRDAARDAWQEFRNACGNVEQDAWTGIHDELKAKLLGKYKGMVEFADGAESILERRWRDAVQAASVPSLAPLKWLLTAGGVLGLAMSLGIIHPKPPTHSFIPSHPDSIIPSPVPINSELDTFVNDVAASVPQTSYAMTQDAAVPDSVIAALPPAVAAVAREPVQVTVAIRNGERQTVVTSLGQVYWHASQSGRQDIEERAREAQEEAPPDKPYHVEIDHKYDLRSGEEHPGWAWQAQVKSGNSWDGRKGVNDVQQEQH